MNTTGTYSFGIFAIVLASIMWGTTGVAATFAPQVSPVAIGAASMGIGGLLQSLLAFRVIRLNYKKLWAHRTLLVFGGINIVIYPLAFYASMRLAGVTIGTVVSIGSAPLIAAIIESIVDRQRVSNRWIIGAAIGLAGILLLCVMGSHKNAETSPNSMFYIFAGIGLGLMAGLTYAIYSWVARRLMMNNIPSLAVMGALFGCGSTLLIPILLFTGAAFLQSSTNMAVGAYMALVPMFMGYILFGYGLARVQASTATAITLLEPVVAAFLAIIIVGERLSFYGWIGVILILISLIFITIKKTKTT
ncbi:DMT family transporter [Brucellaceae bacterium C25G]